MSSCMRLSIRRKVDLPQPDGPISAVTSPARMVRSTSSSTRWSPTRRTRLAGLEGGRAGRGPTGQRDLVGSRTRFGADDGEGGGGDGGVATLVTGDLLRARGRAARSDAGGGALRAVTPDEAGDDEQRQDEDHQHHGAREPPGDRGGVGLADVRQHE